MRRPSITAARSSFSHTASVVVDDGLTVSVVHVDTINGRRFVANLSKLLDEIDGDVAAERARGLSIEIPQPQNGGKF
jgi:hypothetical protein